MKIVARRERWGLTGAGWLLLTGAVMGVVWLLVLGIHPFLAVTSPVDASILVVEGWSPERVYGQVSELLGMSRYEAVVIVVAVHEGDDLVDASGVAFDDYLASVAAEAGIPRQLVHVVLSPSARKDRTYHAARVVKRWLRENQPRATSLNVATVGTHARRSWWLYRKAFGADGRVGIIALDGASYEPDRWWGTSEGVGEVLYQAIAYGYARLLFREPGLGEDEYAPLLLPERKREFVGAQ